MSLIAGMIGGLIVVWAKCSEEVFTTLFGICCCIWFILMIRYLWKNRKTSKKERGLESSKKNVQTTTLPANNPKPSARTLPYNRSHASERSCYDCKYCSAANSTGDGRIYCTWDSEHYYPGAGVNCDDFIHV